MVIRVSPARMVFRVANTAFLLLVCVVTLIPILNVVSASLSEHTYLQQGKVGILPRGFTLESYKRVLEYPMIKRAYLNTILYTLTGTAISLLLTACGAYPLSRPGFLGRKAFTAMIVFAMLFGGGLIPTFLVVRGVGFYNTIWAIVIPGAVASFYLIIMRTFFQQIPKEIVESATIDGSSHYRILFRIILPLSVPAMMTIGLFYGVNQWNSFFPAMIYLKDRARFPIQIVLRDIVIQNQTDSLMQDVTQGKDILSESIKYATIVVASLPIMMVYPFIQRYFVKGVMLGSVKG
jgi:putative aldouronate transport system permease protein